jgi:tetratricopeptide (TPR) repeat protein
MALAVKRMVALGFKLGLAVALGVMFSGSHLRAQRNGPVKDLLGGASTLFNNPENPPAHGRTENSKSVGMPQATDNDGDKVDDALALGNAARDRTPPDFLSAEKAYRLAWKLNPGDPRPYVGLGNIYFDQQRYAEAAKEYKDAIKLKERAGSSPASGFVSRKARTREIRVEPPGGAGDWHVYLATAMLQQQNLTGAESELRHAVAIEPNKAIWQAQLGYALFMQKRYTESSALFGFAISLDPNNRTYKELREQSSLKSRAASAQDVVLTKKIRDTKWEIREADSGINKGTCSLRTGQRLDCKANGGKQPPYNGMRWKILDGLFELELAAPTKAANLSALPDPMCIGERLAERIYLKCSAPENESHEIWIKQGKD